MAAPGLKPGSTRKRRPSRRPNTSRAAAAVAALYSALSHATPGCNATGCSLPCKHFSFCELRLVVATRSKTAELRVLFYTKILGVCFMLFMQ